MESILFPSVMMLAIIQNRCISCLSELNTIRSIYFLSRQSTQVQHFVRARVLDNFAKWSWFSLTVIDESRSKFLNACLYGLPPLWHRSEVSLPVGGSSHFSSFFSHGSSETAFACTTLEEFAQQILGNTHKSTRSQRCFVISSKTLD